MIAGSKKNRTNLQVKDTLQTLQRTLPAHSQSQALVFPSE